MYTDLLIGCVFAGVVYAAVALRRKRFGSGKSVGNSCDFSQIVTRWEQISCAPFAASLAPFTPAGIYVYAVMSILIGTIPLLIFGIIAYDVISFSPSEHQSFGPEDPISDGHLWSPAIDAGFVERQIGFIGQEYVVGEYYVNYHKVLLLFVICNFFLRMGWGYLQFPRACRSAGWSINEWLQITRDLPGPASIIFRQQPNDASGAGLQTYALLGYPFICFCYFAFFWCVFAGTAKYVVTGRTESVSTVIQLGLFLIVLAQIVRRDLTKRILSNVSPTGVPNPILYLRAFDVDHSFTRPSGFSRLTLEESIVLALMSNKRRVVALGRPGEKLPPLGAERFYVPDDEWQNAINNWIEQSYAIVMIAAKTEATGWELERIFESSAHEKFLILFPREFEHLQFCDGRFKWVTLNMSEGKQRFRYTGILKRRLRKSKLEELLFSRLQRFDVQASNITAGKSQELVGLAFDEDKRPIYLYSSDRGKNSYLECIKWMINRLRKTKTHNLIQPVGDNGADT